MGITNLRGSLEKRYSGLTGELEDTLRQIERVKREADQLPSLSEKVTDLERQIVNARNALLDVHPEWKPESTPAVKPWTHHIPVPFGQCGRRGMNLLRLADRPMTVRQVAFEVLRECGSSDPDRQTLKRVQNAIEAAFRKREGRMIESSGRYPKQWRAINKPEIEFGP